MKILVFTEGTILIFALGKNLQREKQIRMSQQAGIQREENALAFENDLPLPAVEEGSVYDFSSYVPIGNAVEKLITWKNQGASIYYLTSRRIKEEIKIIQKLLREYNFPDYQNLFFRSKGENYKDVAERVMPDILIEDDCISIGGEKEMVYPHINDSLKSKIIPVVIPEFSGIDELADDITEF